VARETIAWLGLGPIMGNDLQTERESFDDTQRIETGACANSYERSSTETQQVPFSSSVDPPRPLHDQREIEDPGSIAEAPHVTISKPSDESKKNVDQPSGRSRQSQRPDIQAALDAVMTTPPTVGDTGTCASYGLVRSDEVVLSDQCINTDPEDLPSQLTASGR
jgi:hypothetical protein